MFSSKENDKDEVTAHFLSLSLFCNDFVFYFYLRKWQLNSQSEEPLSVAAKLPASFNAWPEWSTPRSEYFEDGSLFHILGDITWRTQLAEHDLPGDEVLCFFLAELDVLGNLSGAWLPARSHLPLPHHRRPHHAALHLHLLPLARHVTPRHWLHLPRRIHNMQPSQSDHVLRCNGLLPCLDYMML